MLLNDLVKSKYITFIVLPQSIKNQIKQRSKFKLARLVLDRSVLSFSGNYHTVSKCLQFSYLGSALKYFLSGYKNDYSSQDSFIPK